MTRSRSLLRLQTIEVWEVKHKASKSLQEDEMERMTLMMEVWKRLNDEVLQYMRMLDFWIMFIVALLIYLIKQSRVEGYQDFTVWAALLGAVSTVWIGRMDVLIHRPVPATMAIEWEINKELLAEQIGRIGDMSREEALDMKTLQFKTWENYYKPRLKTGVKILVPLDTLVGIFVFALFLHANNAAYRYLGNVWYAGYFWYGCMLVHFLGWGIIAAAKPLAE